MKNIQVVVIDDSFIVREGLQKLFSRIKYVQTISFASSLDELDGLMRRSHNHFIVLNPQFIQSFPAQYQQLKTSYESTKWIGIVYSHFHADILSKLDGVIDIFDSRDAIAGKLIKWMESSNAETSLQSKDTLTDREVDVLRLLADGKSNKEIGESLNISINTVITHRKNISQKTGIKSVSGLTIYAIVQNLISLENF